MLFVPWNWDEEMKTKVTQIPSEIAIKLAEAQELYNQAEDLDSQAEKLDEQIGGMILALAEP